MTDLMNPAITYRDVPDFPGYKVGTDGSVWSRLKRGSWRSSVMKDAYHRMKPGINTAGYPFVVLSCNGATKSIMVHNLVLELFIGPRPSPDNEGRHFPDRTKTNCAVANLRWGTVAQNAEDRERDGNTAKGVANGNHVLAEDAVREIRSATGRGAVTAMAVKHGVSRITVHSIRTFKTWRHVL